MGVATPVGVGVDAFWAAQIEGRPGVRETSRFDASEFPVRIAGEVDLPAHARLGVEEESRTDRSSQLAAEAARQALEQSGLDVAREDPSRIGVVVGSGLGGVESLGFTYERFVAMGIKGVAGRFIPKHMINHAAASVALRYGLGGPCTSVATACASGADALIAGYELITSGRADVVVAGGAEAPVVPHIVAGFAQLGVLSTRNDEPGAASRPFDAERDGFVLAEGAGILVLESSEHAAARAASILAVFAGFGQTCDAFHMLRPHPDARGAVRAMQDALSSAGLEAEQVGYVNAHGTSTQLNDRHEDQALQSVFGSGPGPVVSATKSLTGHPLGAGGAIEAVATIQALRHGTAPPTVNLRRRDADLWLDVAVVPRPIGSPYALSNSFGFGGHNSVLAFAGPQAQAAR